MANNVEIEEKIGKEVASMLFIKPNKKGEYKTEWGTKTALGLGRTIIQVVEDANDKNLHAENVYILDEDSINGITIKESIFDDEKFEYKIIDRQDFIPELIRWISECTEDRESSKILMMNDLKLLLNITDDYIFSSISTNKYIYSDCEKFDTTCKELLELNETI